MSADKVALIRTGLAASIETLRVLRREAEKFDAPAADLLYDAMFKAQLADGYLERKYPVALKTTETDFVGWDGDGRPVP